MFGFGPVPDGGPAGDARICAPGTPFGEGGDVPLEGRYSVEGARFNSTRTNAYLSLCELDPPFASEQELKSRCDLHSSAFSVETGAFTDLNLMDGVSAATFYDSYPTITPDAQHIVFGSSRGLGVRLYVAAKVMGSFDDAVPMVVPLSPAFEYTNEPYLLGDGQTLYFGAEAGTQWDLYRASGPPPGFGGLDAVPVPGLGGSGNEFAPVVREDELEIFFAADRDAPQLDIYTSTRASRLDAFSPPTRLPQLSTATIDYPLWLSPDGCELYYVNKVVAATLRVARR